MKNKVLIISGATASGKTNLSLKWAKKFDLEIVNFDSLLFYKELNIGTAKPNEDELNSCPHHLINIRSIKDPLNASDYAKLARPIIDDIHSRNKIPLLVGGSGFYLQAVLKGMYDSPTTPDHILEKSEELYEKEGISPFLEILENNDPANFEKLHENDHYRIRRAVEHFWNTGTPFSKAQENFQQESLFEEIHYYLLVPKEKHWEIMEKRSREMIENGLIDEVKKLLSLGFTGEEKPMKSIGYKETVQFIKGEISTLEELNERIYINTRRLAKSQKTWFANIDHKITQNPLEEIPDPQF